MLEKSTGTIVPEVMRRVISSASAMVHKILSGPDFAEAYVSGLPCMSRWRVKGLSSMCYGELELELELWDSPALELGCGMGMELVGVYPRVEGCVLVLGGSKREIVKIRRRRVL
jgi:hypothetical protein